MPMGNCSLWNALWADTTPEWKIREAREADTAPKWQLREAGEGTLVECDHTILDFTRKCFRESIMGTKWETSCSDGNHAMS